MASPNAPQDTEAEKVQTLTPMLLSSVPGKSDHQEESDVRQQEEDSGE